ncbi:hypothetical protein [Streptomyces sp. CB03238]|uniref:hypothetical protein n=1 Tax=Streptomyces sp. CB03238 TaxID=1907777 RepID=UPI000A1201EE|nr:hypothetical protein [Streptomyces sp. CB03238]ORT56412.1 hypothetical protein BKD26_28455 [Streptomyces sp. CB03238]
MRLPGLLRAPLDSSPRTVRLTTEPTALLTDPGAGRLPVAPQRGRFQVRLVDDGAPARAPGRRSLAPPLDAATL